MNDILTSIKTGMAVALATAMTGIATVLDLMPDVYIAKIAALIGIVLTIILIKVHLLKLKTAQIEFKLLKKELDELKN